MARKVWQTDDLVIGTSYACIIGKPSTQNTTPLRPLEGIWDGTFMWLTNPDCPERKFKKQNAVGLTVLGEWTARPHPVWGKVASSMTWQGYAAQAYGHVLRQRALAERLAALGIERAPEPYLPNRDTPNAVSRMLVLNFDELDQLLTKAGA